MHSIRKKDNLRKKVKAEPFNNSRKCRLKTYSNILGAAIKHAKREHYQIKIRNNNGNTRQKWQVIKEFLNSNEPKSHPTAICVNENRYTDYDSTGEVFSSHFSTPVRTNTNTQSKLSLSSLPRTPQSFFLYPTVADKVNNIILSLKNTGPGLDQICSSKIKLVSKELSPILAYLINKLLRLLCFLKALKQGKLSPFLRKVIANAITTIA